MFYGFEKREGTIYGAVIFLGAFLLFQIEPIIGKIILPRFGGSAAVWTTCLLFFQIALLAGYTYAHLSVRYLAPRWQAATHAALLAGSLLVLPVTPQGAARPTGLEEPTIRVLVLLIASVGLPFFLLSATSPLLQAWYSRRRKGVLPYRMFALSNLASLLALLSYPFLVEPAVSTRKQALAWSVLYAGFVLICGFVALAFSGGQNFARTAAAGKVFSPRRGLLWLSLAACASTLLLAITNHVTQNVAAIPLLWVLPLTLYLLSFVLCFESSRWYHRRIWLPATAAALCGIAYVERWGKGSLPIAVILPLYLGGLFVFCMTLHGELARQKPEPRGLTSFYLMCSLGGAAGGLFVGVASPHFFRSYSEMPLALIWCAFLVYVVLDIDARKRPVKGRLWSASCLAAFAGTMALSFCLGPIILGLGPRFAARNFYGALQVDEIYDPPDHKVRRLINGVILHGTQFLDSPASLRPTSYYGPGTGVGLALQECGGVRNRKVGIVGLGTGTIAAYGKPGDRFRFYEINPLVVQVAKTEFTYLKDSQAGIETVLGDARLSLEAEPAQGYDVLVVDAFSGDAIPVHLLTLEAFALYFRHLKGSGVLAVHISNRYLDLAPVVRAAAVSLGKQTVVIRSWGDQHNLELPAEWLLVSGRREFFDNPMIRGAASGFQTQARRERVWTDDYSNLFQVLR